MGRRAGCIALGLVQGRGLTAGAASDVDVRGQVVSRCAWSWPAAACAACTHSCSRTSILLFSLASSVSHAEVASLAGAGAILMSYKTKGESNDGRPPAGGAARPTEIGWPTERRGEPGLPLRSLAAKVCQQCCLRAALDTGEMGQRCRHNMTITSQPPPSLRSSKCTPQTLQQQVH